MGGEQAGNIADEWLANVRRVKIAKDMNGTLFSALLGNGGRLQKLYGTVDKEKGRVEEQARQAPDASGWQGTFLSDRSSDIQTPLHNFHNRLASPEVSPSDHRGFIPRRVTDRDNRFQKKLGSRPEWQNGVIGGPRSGLRMGNRWQSTEPAWHLPNREPEMSRHRNLLKLDESYE